MAMSLAGLVGAAVGTGVAGALYGPLIDAIEGRLRKRRAATEDRATFAQEIALLRRGILAGDMLLCAAAGYWLGPTVGGLSRSPSAGRGRRQRGYRGRRPGANEQFA